MAAKSTACIGWLCLLVGLDDGPGAKCQRGGCWYWSHENRSPWWQVRRQPRASAEYTTDPPQQPVDFAILSQDRRNGTLADLVLHPLDQLSRLDPAFLPLGRRKSPTDHDWKPMGIVMTSDTQLGEVGCSRRPTSSAQAASMLMFYGTGDHIAVATSRDGKEFERRISRGTARWACSPMASARVIR